MSGTRSAPVPPWLDAARLLTRLGRGGAREEERASRAAGAFPKTGIAVVREEFYGLHPGFRVATVVRGNDRSGVLRLLCGRGCERLMFENCCRGLD